MVGVGRPVEEEDAGPGGERRRSGSAATTSGAAALADVRDAFDQCRHLNLSPLGGRRSYRGRARRLPRVRRLVTLTSRGSHARARFLSRESVPLRRGPREGPPDVPPHARDGAGGPNEDALLGCDFILKMDARFAPARRLLASLRGIAAGTVVDLAEFDVLRLRAPAPPRPRAGAAPRRRRLPPRPPPPLPGSRLRRLRRPAPDPFASSGSGLDDLGFDDLGADPFASRRRPLLAPPLSSRPRLSPRTTSASARRLRGSRAFAGPPPTRTAPAPRRPFASPDPFAAARSDLSQSPLAPLIRPRRPRRRPTPSPLAGAVLLRAVRTPPRRRGGRSRPADPPVPQAGGRGRRPGPAPGGDRPLEPRLPDRPLERGRVPADRRRPREAERRGTPAGRPPLRGSAALRVRRPPLGPERIPQGPHALRVGRDGAQLPEPDRRRPRSRRPRAGAAGAGGARPGRAVPARRAGVARPALVRRRLPVARREAREHGRARGGAGRAVDGARSRRRPAAARSTGGS